MCDFHINRISAYAFILVIDACRADYMIHILSHRADYYKNLLIYLFPFELNCKTSSIALEDEFFVKALGIQLKILREKNQFHVVFFCLPVSEVILSVVNSFLLGKYI